MKIRVYTTRANKLHVKKNFTSKFICDTSLLSLITSVGGVHYQQRHHPQQKLLYSHSRVHLLTSKLSLPPPLPPNACTLPRTHTYEQTLSSNNKS